MAYGQGTAECGGQDIDAGLILPAQALGRPEDITFILDGTPPSSLKDKGQHQPHVCIDMRVSGERVDDAHVEQSSTIRSRRELVDPLRLPLAPPNAGGDAASAGPPGQAPDPSRPYDAEHGMFATATRGKVTCIATVVGSVAAVIGTVVNIVFGLRNKK